MMHEIETPRLWLRRPTLEDELILEDLWRSEEVRQFLGGVVADDVIKERLTEIQNHWDHHGFGLCAVYKKDTQQIVGLCGLHRRDDGLELSYKFFPNYWGQGLGKEVTIACLNYGFTTLKDGSIIAITQDANHPSCRLLEAIGMKHIQSFTRFNALQRLYEMTRNDHKLRYD